MPEPVILTHLRTYWLCGLAGGVVHDLLFNRGCLLLPSYDRATRRLGLGTLASCALGIAAAILADNSPIVAFSGAILGGAIINRIINPLLGRAGRVNGAAPERLP